MIKFNSIGIKDFGPLGMINLVFENGLWLIKGDNRDTDAADSNGSGKSHLFDAIQWGLFGETNDGARGDELIRIGQPEMDVLIEWSDDGHAYKLERQKRRGKAVGLQLACDEQAISMATPELTQAEVERILAMDVKTWRNTVVYGQGDLARFADPKTTDGERKSILKRILRLDVLDAALKLARKEVETADKAIAATQANIGKGEAFIAGLGTTDGLDAELARIDADLATQRVEVAKAPKIKHVLDLLNQRIKDFEALNVQMAKARADIRTLEQHVSSCDRNGAVAASAAKSLDKQIQQLERGICPTCGAKTSNTPEAKKRVTAMKQELAGYAEKVNTLLESREQYVQTITEAQAGIETLEAQLEQDRAWREKRGQLQSELQRAESAGDEMDRLKADRNGVVARKAEHAIKLGAYRDRLGVLRQDLSEQERAAELSRYWVKGFGNAGLPSLMMDAIVPQISTSANKYLETLADGDIKVTFDTQSKLKSGESRDKLAMELCIEGVQGSRPSGGQKRKISIAVDLALMDLVASREHSAIDFLGMDEVLDGLDAAGKSRVMDLLRKLRETKSSIYVVSHDSGLAELFESQITIVKEGGVARVEVDG